MAGKMSSLQDNFLIQARKDGVPVTLHLVNGFQLKGLVKSFDNFTIVIDSMGKQQMIYKHAISTITPARTVSLMGDSDNEVVEEPSVPEEESAVEVKRKPGRPKKVVASGE